MDRFQHARGQGLERGEDPLTGVRDGFEARSSVSVQELVQLVDGHRVGKVALVELDDVRQRGQALAVLVQVLLEVLQRLEVLLNHRG